MTLDEMNADSVTFGFAQIRELDGEDVDACEVVCVELLIRKADLDAALADDADAGVLAAFINSLT